MYVNNRKDSFVEAVNFINEVKNDNRNTVDCLVELIMDRFFFESNILLDQQLKDEVRLCYKIIDDTLLIAKKAPENDISGSLISEYFNYDIYIGEYFISVVNYVKYTLSKDINYQNLISSFIRVLSSCIELILYLLRNKGIYLPRFLYIIHTESNKYFSFEYKSSNFFLKRIPEFSSVNTLDIKRSVPLFCFISTKPETKYTMNNDNFYDVFLRLFLNLNKVAKDHQELNADFLRKIHKNIFNEYYDTFILIAFDFEAFLLVNDFFMQNNYLSISKNQRFENCYIIPQCRPLKYFATRTKDRCIFNNVVIYYFDYDKSFYCQNKRLFFFNVSKADFILKEINKKVEFCLNSEITSKSKSLFSKISRQKHLSKENKAKSFLKIMEFYYKKGVTRAYFLQRQFYLDICKEYSTEKIKKKTQNIEMRVMQLTEDARKNNKIEEKKKECCIV